MYEQRENNNKLTCISTGNNNMQFITGVADIIILVCPLYLHTPFGFGGELGQTISPHVISNEVGM